MTKYTDSHIERMLAADLSDRSRIKHTLKVDLLEGRTRRPRTQWVLGAVSFAALALMLIAFALIMGGGKIGVGIAPADDPTEEATTGPTADPDFVPDRPWVERPHLYVVQPGDTLWSIVARYEYDESIIPEVLELNGMESEEVTAGQRLLIPYDPDRSFTGQYRYEGDDLQQASTSAGFNILVPHYIPTGWAPPEFTNGKYLVNEPHDGEIHVNLVYVSNDNSHYLSISQFMPAIPLTWVGAAAGEGDVVEFLSVLGHDAKYVSWQTGGVAVTSSSQITWNAGGVTYTVASDVLTREELLKIAESMTTGEAANPTPPSVDATPTPTVVPVELYSGPSIDEASAAAGFAILTPSNLPERFTEVLYFVGSMTFESGTSVSVMTQYGPLDTLTIHQFSPAMPMSEMVTSLSTMYGGDYQVTDTTVDGLAAIYVTADLVHGSNGTEIFYTDTTLIWEADPFTFSIQYVNVKDKPVNPWLTMEDLIAIAESLE